MRLPVLFKEKYNFLERCEESNRITNKYPERIPIICEKMNISSLTTPVIDKNKYLVPNDLNVGQFMYVIRKRIHIKREQAIFLFVNKTLVSSNLTLIQLYDTMRDADGFLYIQYSLENTFG